MRKILALLLLLTAVAFANGNATNYTCTTDFNATCEWYVCESVQTNTTCAETYVCTTDSNATCGWYVCEDVQTNTTCEEAYNCTTDSNATCGWYVCEGTQTNTTCEEAYNCTTDSNATCGWYVCEDVQTNTTCEEAYTCVYKTENNCKYYVCDEEKLNETCDPVVCTEYYDDNACRVIECTDGTETIKCPEPDEDNKAPKANEMQDRIFLPNENQEVTLKLYANMWDEDGRIVNCDWNFGDGTTEEKGNTWLDHSFKATDSFQEFNVKITCTDNDGASTSQSHTIYLLPRSITYDALKKITFKGKLVNAYSGESMPYIRYYVGRDNEQQTGSGGSFTATLSFEGDSNTYSKWKNANMHFSDSCFSSANINANVNFGEHTLYPELYVNSRTNRICEGKQQKIQDISMSGDTIVVDFGDVPIAPAIGFALFSDVGVTYDLEADVSSCTDHWVDERKGYYSYRSSGREKNKEFRIGNQLLVDETFKLHLYSSYASYDSDWVKISSSDWNYQTPNPGISLNQRPWQSCGGKFFVYEGGSGSWYSCNDGVCSGIYEKYYCPQDCPKEVTVMVRGSDVREIGRYVSGEMHIASAEVEVLDAWTSEIIASGKTNDDGKVSFKLSPNKPYILKAYATNYEDYDSGDETYWMGGWSPEGKEYEEVWHISMWPEEGYYPVLTCKLYDYRGEPMWHNEGECVCPRETEEIVKDQMFYCDDGGIAPPPPPRPPDIEHDEITVKLEEPFFLLQRQGAYAPEIGMAVGMYELVVPEGRGNPKAFIVMKYTEEIEQEAQPAVDMVEYFYNDDCVHCERVLPTIERLESAYPNVEFVYMDTSDADTQEKLEELAEEFGVIAAVPSVLVGKDLLIGTESILDKLEGKLMTSTETTTSIATGMMVTGLVAAENMTSSGGSATTTSVFTSPVHESLSALTAVGGGGAIITSRVAPIITEAVEEVAVEEPVPTFISTSGGSAGGSVVQYSVPQREEVREVRGVPLKLRVEENRCFHEPCPLEEGGALPLGDSGYYLHMLGVDVSGGGAKFIITKDEPENIDPECACPAVYEPMCGDNRRTYPNTCSATCAGVELLHKGACANDRPDLPDVEPDELIQVALKIEGIRIKLETISEKVRNIYEYYDRTGNTDKARRWLKVVEATNDGNEHLDELVVLLKQSREQNLDANEVRDRFAALKDVMENILDAILEAIG